MRLARYPVPDRSSSGRWRARESEIRAGSVLASAGAPPGSTATTPSYGDLQPHVADRHDVARLETNLAPDDPLVDGRAIRASSVRQPPGPVALHDHGVLGRDERVVEHDRV